VRLTVRAIYAYRELLRNLVAKDLKIKYRGSVLGFLWSLANPLLMIGIYSVAFGIILKTPTEGFVFYLLIGILAWTFFVNSAVMSAGAIVDNAGLLKSVFFPRAILPVATVLFNFAQYLLTTIVFLPLMMAIYRVPPSAPMLLYPIFLTLQLIFTIGIALLLSTATVFFRDVRHLLEVALAALFWLTPIVYQLGQLTPPLASFVRVTPMAPYIVAYQQIFFYRAWPDATTWALAAGYAAAALAAGLALTLRHEDALAEQI
jgi:ABC-2 type transport system permease protein